MTYEQDVREVWRPSFDILLFFSTPRLNVAACGDTSKHTRGRRVKCVDRARRSAVALSTSCCFHRNLTCSQNHKSIFTCIRSKTLLLLAIVQLHSTIQHLPHFRSIRTYTAYHQNTIHQNKYPSRPANMSNSVQDPTVAQNQVNDAPVEAPAEKGKGKAADEAMDDDEDDSESGEVSRTNT